ncbi:hypothetical protein NECAME_15932 [Necator americanus]|uniref:NR LBD domain-containing protein n=1 Tax=Necator americanus TaxID=51031 RepID=W2SHA5_NECAM|nr:hypothetical protein NECAME_15932 [Necator americanus]ETN68246.1 hypothetical protein NECAME_15932 [Necator americanus]
MIMCEAFRTPEHVDEKKLETAVISRSAGNDHLQGMLSNKNLDLFRIKTEPTSDSPELATIRLPTEYGTLPADYGSLIPQDYGRPVRGIEGRSEMHTFFDSKLFEDSVGSLKTNRALPITEGVAADTEGIDSASQRNVAAEQKKLLTALHRHIQRNYKGTLADERYANILLRIPTIRKVAAKKNESLQMIDMLNLFALNSLVKETALGVRSSCSSTPALGATINGEYPSE